MLGNTAVVAAGAAAAAAVGFEVAVEDRIEMEVLRIVQEVLGPVATCPDEGEGNPASSDQDHRASASAVAFEVVADGIAEAVIVVAVPAGVDVGDAGPAWRGTIADSDVD